MVAPRRVRLPEATQSHAMTHVLRIRHRGEWADLTLPTIAANAKNPAGTVFSPTISVPTQVDDELGVIYLTFSAASLATVGIYLLDVYIQNEPLAQRFEFEVKDEETV